MTDPLATGQRVLAALDRGRALAIAAARERGEAHTLEVRRLLDLDILAGRSAWGRAGRIARRMGGRIKERSVRRILDKLSSVSDSSCSNAAHSQQPSGT
jgi:hypothetical protein